jgi:hypothetical protein
VFADGEDQCGLIWIKAQLIEEQTLVPNQSKPKYLWRISGRFQQTESEFLLDIVAAQTAAELICL